MKALRNRKMKEREIHELETKLRTLRLGRVSQFLLEGMAKPSQSSNRDVKTPLAYFFLIVLF